VWLTLQRVDMREGQIADVLGEAKAVIGQHGDKNDGRGVATRTALNASSQL
jgi:hypothetical protein